MRKYKDCSMWFFVSLLVVCVAGCSGHHHRKGHPVVDITHPTVILVAPLDLSTEVLIDGTVVATFSEPMDQLTINTVSFTVLQGETPVTVTVGYADNMATFTPDASLLNGALYDASITIVATDLAGNALEANYPWSFTTAIEIIPPTVTLVDPLDLAVDVPLDKVISATFSEAMDPLSITDLTFTIEEQGGTPVIGTVGYADMVATFTLQSSLKPGMLYSAKITTGATDLAGNALGSDYLWSFTALAEAVPPTVELVDPLNLAIDVPLNKVITATFSEAMDPLTITDLSFTLEDGTGAPVLGTVGYAAKLATFTLRSDLTASTMYTARITTAATDVAGNALVSNYVWSFTTGEAAVHLLAVDLGAAATFGIMAGYAITNIPTSSITGDLCMSPSAESLITGFSQTDYAGYATSPQVTGRIYAADMEDPTPANLTAAKGALTTAYVDAAGRTPVPTGTFLNPGSGDLGGLNLVPGLYKFTGAAVATSSFTLTGSADDVWIFQIGSSLIASNGITVTLAGGAQAKNIFWQVGTQATLGTTVAWEGTLMAALSITMQTGASLNGRLLASSGTVALDSNVIVVPAP